jgi:hypothetical protein
LHGGGRLRRMIAAIKAETTTKHMRLECVDFNLEWDNISELFELHGGFILRFSC